MRLTRPALVNRGVAVKDHLSGVTKERFNGPSSRLAPVDSFVTKTVAAEIQRELIDATRFCNGKATLVEGNYHRAAMDADKWISDEPRNATAWCLGGLAQLFLGNLETSIRFFSKSISLNPSWGLCYVGRGEAYRLQEKYPEALSDFATSWLHNGKGLVSLNCGLVHLKKGDYTEAQRCFERAARTSSNRLAAVLYTKHEQHSNAVYCEEDYLPDPEYPTDYLVSSVLHGNHEPVHRARHVVF